MLTHRRYALVVWAALFMEVSLAHGASPPPVLWTRQFGSTGDDAAMGIEVDGSGSIHVAGFMNGASFPTSLFAAKYDNAGNGAWLTQVGSGSVSGWEWHTTLDSAGDMFIDNYTPSGQGGGNLVAKVSANGNLIWSKNISGRSLAADSAGNLYVVGSFLAKYDPDGNLMWSTPLVTSAFAAKISALGSLYFAGETYVAKYDLSGNPQWWVSTPFSGTVGALAVDADDNVYIGAGYSLNAGKLRKYSPNGALLWSVSQPGTIGFFGVAADAQGNAYAAGVGGSGIYACAYDSAGTSLLQTSFAGLSPYADGSGAPFNIGYDIAADASGRVYLAGLTNGHFSGQTNLGGRDAVLIALAPEPNALFVLSGLVIAELMRRKRRCLEEID